MFQFPRLSSPSLWVREGDAATAGGGFAHSGTPGSTGVCPSPGIIAACRALRRLHVPRHPPCALDILPPRIRAGRRDSSSLSTLMSGCRIPSRGDAPGRSRVQLTSVKNRRLVNISTSLKFESVYRRIDQIMSSLIRLSLCGSQGTRGVTPGTGYAERGGAMGQGTPAPKQVVRLCSLLPSESLFAP